MIKTTSKNGGTTALIALIMKNTVYIANAGDSRAVLLTDDEVIRLTCDHKPDNPQEEQRIQQSGGVVTRVTNKLGKTISRVNGMLAVSRALGDIMLQPFVSAEPDVFQFDISNRNRILILACDGIWDVLTDEEATSVASSESNPEQSAVKLRDTALSKGSTDNIIAVVVKFPGVVNTELPQPPTLQTSPNLGWPKSTIIVVLVIVAFLGTLTLRSWPAN